MIVEPEVLGEREKAPQRRQLTALDHCGYREIKCENHPLYGHDPQESLNVKVLYGNFPGRWQPDLTVALLSGSRQHKKEVYTGPTKVGHGPQPGRMLEQHCVVIDENVGDCQCSEMVTIETTCKPQEHSSVAR
jgi:hypothetical protein